MSVYNVLDLIMCLRVDIAYMCVVFCGVFSDFFCIFQTKVLILCLHWKQKDIFNMKNRNLELYNERHLRLIERRGRFSAAVLRVLSDVVSEVFSVPARDILGSRRGRQRVFDARMCLMWHLREDAGMGWSEIGRYCGHSHASVIHAVREYDEITALGVDKEFSLNAERVGLALSLSVPYADAVRGYRESLKLP